MSFARVRISTVLIFGFTLSLTLTLLPSQLFAREHKRSNILLIMADDQRGDTVRALGNPEIHTPHLDQLVERGFHFSNAYCMGSMTPAVCLPSRTMLLTGRSVWRLPSLSPVEAPAGVPLLPRVLSDAGYATFHCGKSNNACRYGNAAFEVNIETVKTDANDMGRHADEAIRFLNGHDVSKPFFMYLAPPVPHDPRIAPQAFLDMYRPEELSLPKNYMPSHPFNNGELEIRDELLASKPRDPHEMRIHLAAYYACISDLDAQVGRIIASLRQLKYLDDTVIIFTSDQGLAVGGCHGLMGKQNLYEHVKPPLILGGRGVPHGRSSALVYLFDLYPTLCDLADAKTPATVEGGSLLPIVRGEQAAVRDDLFAAYRECQRMIRSERWKLIEYRAAGQRHTQLFDLHADPYELTNLASESGSEGHLVRLRALMAERAHEFGDPVVPYYAQP